MRYQLTNEHPLCILHPKKVQNDFSIPSHHYIVSNLLLHCRFLSSQTLTETMSRNCQSNGHEAAFSSARHLPASDFLRTSLCSSLILQRFYTTDPLTDSMLQIPFFGSAYLNILSGYQQARRATIIRAVILSLMAVMESQKVFSPRVMSV